MRRNTTKHLFLMMHEGEKGCVFLEGRLKAVCVTSLFTRAQIVFALIWPP